MPKPYSLLCFILFTITACGGPRPMEELTQKETTQLNTLLQSRDDCLVREIERVDDGRADIRKVADIVAWRCKSYYDQISSTISDTYHVDLSSAYKYKVNMKEHSMNEITEAILAQRRILGDDAVIPLQRGF